MQSIIRRVKIIVRKPATVVFLRIDNKYLCPRCNTPVRTGGLCGTCYNEETSGGPNAPRCDEQMGLCWL